MSKGLTRVTKVRNMDVKPITDTKTSDYAPPKPVNICLSSFSKQWERKIWL